MRIADRWYERKILADGLTLLTEPRVHPFLRCNIWHLRGRDSDLLIDTGLGLSSLRAEIADLIDKPLMALATHIHYDHVGCLHEFEQRLMHHHEADRMTTYREFATLSGADFPPAERALFEQAAPIGEWLIDALPAADYDPARYSVRGASVTRALSQGEIVDLGDRHFEVLHLPGHSPGSMGLWEADTGTLFSGDAIYDGVLLDELPDSDIGVYIETMKRLRSLPVTVVHGGHEPSFGRARLVELPDAYLPLRDR